jgi:hypothetical protein
MRFIAIVALCNVDICHQISTYLFVAKDKEGRGMHPPGLPTKVEARCLQDSLDSGS